MKTRLAFRWLLARALALVLSVGLAGSATADELGLGARVRKAAAASDLGNHVEAAKEYEAAYMMTSDPNMLVHVGQAWQLAGDRQKAVTAFRSYVRVAPNGEQRFLCEAKLRELEDQRMPPAAPPMMVTAGAPMPVAALPPPAPYAAYPPPGASFPTNQVGATATVEPSPFYSHWPFWVAAGAAVAGGVIAGILWARQDTDLAMPTTTFGTKQY